MATRRSIQSLSRRLRPLVSSLYTTEALAFRSLDLPSQSSSGFAPFVPPFVSRCIDPLRYGPSRCFSTRAPSDDDADDDFVEDDEDDDDGDDVDDDDEEEEGNESGPSRRMQSGKSDAEKKEEAQEIGYRVVGPLESSENPFKPYEPAYAVVQVGSHQFKVSNGDSIFTERLKYCEVNDKLILNRVLMLGSQSETIIGRPILPNAAVHAVVEEHALDAKVIIFKKKRRKNYRRTKGHRQELTKLRITDIQGIIKSENIAVAA